jgi:FAD/FMN-containing dehydrogenase
MPQVVALCADYRDVVLAVLWARNTGTPFAVRGGGHNYMCASSSDGLIISTRAMAKATVRGSRLRAQAGVRNRDLARLLPEGGAGAYLLPGGNCPNVGVAGLTLGGGIGPNAPWAGLAADRLREVTMVTAAGDVVTASPSQNSGLFWGLRGAAGGNFGVVTELVYDMVEVPVTRATTFVFWFTGADACRQAGSAWQQVRTNGARSVSGTWLAVRDDAGPRVRVKGQALLGEAGARDLLAPLFAIPADTADVVERSWWDAYAWYVAPVSPSNTFWDRSLYAERDLSEETLSDVIDVVSRAPITDGQFGGCQILGWVGGAVNDVPANATAYVHRGASAILEVMSGWPAAIDPTAWPTPVPRSIGDWVAELWETLLPHSNGQSYQNFPDPGLNDWGRAYYGSNLDRLTRVKGKWDPENVFTYEQGVPLPG